MKTLPFVVLVVACALAACIPMKTLRGSSGTYLTPAGAKVNVNRPSATTVGVVQQIFAERGFPLVNRVQVSPTNVVLFFRGTRNSITNENNTADAVYAAGGQLGSWFAVRVTDDGVKSVVSFYGKPVVYGQEVCADGDSQLNDVQYRCVDVRVREDWPAGQLVEGREETEVITSVTTTITERLPER